MAHHHFTEVVRADKGALEEPVHSSPYHDLYIHSPCSFTSNSHLLPGEMTSFASLPFTNPPCSLGSPSENQTALIANEKYQNHFFFNCCMQLLPRRPDFSSWGVFSVCRTKMILGGHQTSGATNGWEGSSMAWDGCRWSNFHVQRQLNPTLINTQRWESQRALKGIRE